MKDNLLLVIITIWAVIATIVAYNFYWHEEPCPPQETIVKEISIKNPTLEHNYQIAKEELEKLRKFCIEYKTEIEDLKKIVKSQSLTIQKLSTKNVEPEIPYRRKRAPSYN